MRDSYAKNYDELYHRHWWWRTREKIVLDQIGRLNLQGPIDILDVGCGNGLLLPKLAPFGNPKGLETNTRLLDPAHPFAGRIHTKPLGDPHYRNLRFHLITALDVIEHIENDHDAVAQMFHMLHPAGKLLITVPAFMSLWDEHDRLNLHFRRYTTSSLRKLLEPHGRIILQRYLFPSLFLPKFAVKIINTFTTAKTPQHNIPSNPINQFMQHALTLENAIQQKLHLPWGASVLAVVEKPATIPASMRKPTSARAA